MTDISGNADDVFNQHRLFLLSRPHRHYVITKIVSPCGSQRRTVFRTNWRNDIQRTKQVRMYYGSGFVAGTVESITSSEIPLSIDAYIYLNNSAKFHPNAIWNRGAFDFLGRGRPNNNNKRKIRAIDRRSVPDLK